MKKTFIILLSAGLFFSGLSTSCKKDDATSTTSTPKEDEDENPSEDDPEDPAPTIHTISDIEEIALHYPFDGNYKNTVNESNYLAIPYKFSSHYSNTGDAVQDASAFFGEDRNGNPEKALLLDGDHFLNIADGFPTLEGSFSVHFWMKLTDIDMANGSYFPILSKTKECNFSLKNRFDLMLSKNYPVYADEFSDLPSGTVIKPAYVDLEADLKAATSGSSQSVRSPSDINLASNEWTNVIVVVDNTAKESRLYLDGKLVKTSEWVFGGKMELSATKDDVFFIGRSVCSQKSARYKRYKGYLDDLVIIKRMLKKSEIEDLAGL